MTSRNSPSIQRKIVGQDTSGQVSSTQQRVDTLGQPPILQRAVVIDVITNPASLTPEELDNYAETVNNAELVDVMPVNSIVARITSNEGGTGTQTNTVLFPFFSSHMLLPVKPGEVVYVIYEDFKETGSKLGYWFTRASNIRTVEDPNYTHHDRKFDNANNPSNYSLAEKRLAGDSFPGPNFQNGGGTETTATLETDQNRQNQGRNPFEQIKDESKAYGLFTPEPVPRWNKRPGEFVIQGSNNSLISLGEDRNGPVDNDDDEKLSAAAIDMVVGRGRFPPTTETEEPVGTATRVIRNSRGELETDKAPFRRGFNKKENPKEGDPDFVNDAARIYLSQQTEADRRFQVSLNTGPTPASNLSLPDIDGQTGSANRSFLVGKADHIRFVARKDTQRGINGSVLLVKEGEQDQDLGYFFIDDTGKIQVESTKIYLGKSAEEAEPYVLWSKFDETRQELQNQINVLEQKVNKLSSILSSAFSSAFGNLGAPIPSLNASAATITQNSNDLSKELVSPRDKAKVASSHDSQSKKIFGE